MCKSFILLEAQHFLKRAKDDNFSLWWSHSISLWRHNGAHPHSRAKHYEYFAFKNCTQTACVYWSKNPIESLCICSW